MSRLIVLSNRVKMPNSDPMAGGLAVALQGVLKENAGIWLGWNGDIAADPDDTRLDNEVYHTDSFTMTDGFDTNEFTSSQSTPPTNIQKRDVEVSVTYMTTALTAKQYQYFYCGFANSVLWSLLHEQPSLMVKGPQDYTGYQAVNYLFARQLKKTAKPDDVIWVHDYHFLSVAYYCRQLGMTNRIGFFLHIPFVSLSFWQQLDESAELISHLAHYDVIGVQTQQDKANCLAVFQHYLKKAFSEDSLFRVGFSKPNLSDALQLRLNLEYLTEHLLTINAYPIGVNVDQIQAQVRGLSAQCSENDATKTPQLPNTRKIIAVDRVDYSKGLLARFSAYRLFLQQNPDYQNKLALVQVACPSRLDLPVYQKLLDAVRQSVNDVNQPFLSGHSLSNHSSHANKKRDEKQMNTILEIDTSLQTDTSLKDASEVTASLQTDKPLKDTSEVTALFASNDKWQAITYSEKVQRHKTLMIAFWHSDIGWVNSLKDGMNLVAKEYIAAQNPDNPGVLLLSKYAGAAEQMQEALIIDPLNTDSVIHGLKMALNMPLTERKRRYQILFQGLQEHSLHAWQQSFLDDLYELICA